MSKAPASKKGLGTEANELLFELATGMPDTVRAVLALMRARVDELALRLSTCPHNELIEMRQKYDGAYDLYRHMERELTVNRKKID
jgi:hypothetical protein